jgi:hypothetical protein
MQNGWEPKSNKNSSSKPSPKGFQHKLSFLNNVESSTNIDKLPNLRAQGEKSLERNNSVFNRKDLIKQEYNKIIETRLPNILNLMNQEKHYNI